MSRILIPVESVTISHVVRPLQIAKALRNRGIEVVFGAADRYRHLLEREGFESRSLYCADPGMLMDCVRRVDFRGMIACLDDYLDSDLELIKAQRGTDLVLSDFRFTARFAARKSGIPHAALVNGFFSPYYGVLPSLPRAVIPSWMPQSLRESRFLRGLVKKFIPRYHGGPYRALCRRHRIADEVNSGFDFSVSEDLTLICDLPEFTPQVNLPAHYHFTGPILWEPDEGYSALPPDMETSGRPLIYVSLGTSGSEKAFQEVVSALGRLPYDVILSTGDVKCSDLPPNVISAPFVKPSGILQKAALMICHSGNGSIYQALNEGVPVLCIPSFYDQEWNAQRVCELGLGESLFYRDANFTSISKAVDRLVNDPAVRARAREFQGLMRSYNGPETGADLIIQFLNQRTAIPASLPTVL